MVAWLVRLTAVVVPGVLVAGCGRAVLTVEDIAYVPDRPTIFVAQLERETGLGMRDGLENEVVTFSLDGVALGEARTDDEGRAQFVHRFELAAGSKVFTTAAAVGHERLEVERPIHHWRADTIIVVVDVDNTVSRTDYGTLLTEEVDTESEPVAGAREVLWQLDEHYELLYLTARPRFLLDTTREWLARHEFPAAPIVTTASVSDVFDQAETKRELLRVRKELWPHLLIGIGDKEADIEAYSSLGMLGIVLGPPAEAPPERPNVIMLENWPAIGRFFAQHRETLRDPERLRDVVGQQHGRRLLGPEE